MLRTLYLQGICRFRMMMNEAAKIQYDFHHVKAESWIKILCDFIFLNQSLIVNPEAFPFVYAVVFLINFPDSALFYSPVSAQWIWVVLYFTCTTAWTDRKSYQGRQMLTYSKKTSYCDFLVQQTIILPWYQFGQHQNCNKKCIFHKKDSRKSTIVFYKYRYFILSHSVHGILPQW